MKPDSDLSTSACGEERNRSSTEWTPSIIDDSDEGRSSSTLSWTDEAENAAAEHLRLRFEQFEAALYSEAPSDMLSNSERAEKEIWNEYTPHLRVIGKKINLIRRDYRSEEESSRSSSPGGEEVIVQDPDVTTDTGGGGKARASSCRSCSSGSKDTFSVKEDPTVKDRLAKAVAEKLLEQAWPNAKKVGLVPKTSKSCHVSPRKVSAQSQPSAESDSSLKENSPSFRILHPKDGRTAHPELSLKPLNCQSAPRHHRAKSSYFDSNFLKPLSRNARNPCSARHSRKKSEKKEHETESMSDNPLDSADNSSRHGFLPPIESLTITPKLPSKRANSAMLRFTKAQPRTRPTTSRSKKIAPLERKRRLSNLKLAQSESLFLAPIESFSICQSNKFTITPIAEHSSSVFSSRLPLCPSRKTNKRISPPRWRY